jgi:hypothetical protein
MATELLEPPGTEEKDRDTGRRMDSELRTMGAILRMLDDEEPTARRRIVAYISDRFNSGQ